MPAPLASVIQAQIELAMLAAVDSNGEPCFLKRDPATGMPLNPPQLAEGTEQLVKAFATGLNAVWTTWQLTQTVGGVTVGTGVVPPGTALP